MSFFDTLINILSTGATFLGNMVLSLINAIRVLGSTVAVSVTAIGWVTPVIGTCISIVAGIGILKLILGWGNS